jgi:2-polyprenyl-3-methyl-5-hydroxy-6-metoxy-1,4-benzoquinol methylase
MVKHMSTYVFDQAWQRERDRLRSLESLFDAYSGRLMSDLGVRPGWRCLEVGCGAGGVALWLADRVGPDGQVVATDLDTRFVDGHGRDNLEMLVHAWSTTRWPTPRSTSSTGVPCWSTSRIERRCCGYPGFRPGS